MVIAMHRKIFFFQIQTLIKLPESILDSKFFNFLISKFFNWSSTLEFNKLEFNKMEFNKIIIYLNARLKRLFSLNKNK